MDEQRMQVLAKEMNVAATAFLVEQDHGYAVRWFSPTTELELCGHATLASAHVLWETCALSVEQEIRFHSRSGLLTARYLSKGNIELDFPAKFGQRTAPPESLIDAFGLVPLDTVFNGRDYLVVVESAAEVRSLAPDFAMLRRVDMRGVMVTARAVDQEFDFVSRFFAPSAGIDEDPVTGSAHCFLGPYWGRRLKKTQLTGRQVSSRGGTVHTRLEGDRVFLGGQAVTIMECKLLVP